MSTTDIIFQVIRVAEIEAEIEQVAWDALSSGNLSPRWRNAVMRAKTWLMAQDAIEYSAEEHTLVYISDDRTYIANGVCQCEAHASGNPCKHRAAGRLVQRALERKA